MEFLSKADLENILKGACFLASGGGGPISIGENIINMIKSNNIPMYTPDEFKNVRNAASVAGIGSPDASKGQKDLFKNGPVRALQLLEEELQKVSNDSAFMIQTLVFGEIGSWNTLIPMLVADRLSLCVLDGDSAGRAIPQLAMASFNYNGVPIAPFAVSNDADDESKKCEISFYTDNPVLMDEVTRSALSSSAFGDVGGFATWYMKDAETIINAVIPYTITRAKTIGQMLGKPDSYQKIIDFFNKMVNLKAYLLFKGKLKQYSEESIGGYDIGKVVFSNDKNDEFWIYNQNENLLAWDTKNPVPVAMGPDLICYVTSEGETFSNSELDEIQKKNVDVYIIGIQSEEKMRMPEVLNVFLNTFKVMGYAGPYIEIEKMHK